MLNPFTTLSSSSHPVARFLATRSRERPSASSSPEKRNLRVPPPDQARQLHAAAVHPARQLLRCDRVGVLAGIEAADQRGAARGAAADVEGPTDESAVLIGVEADVDVLSDAPSGNLQRICQGLDCNGTGRCKDGLTSMSLWRRRLPLAVDRGMGYGTSVHRLLAQRWP